MMKYIFKTIIVFVLIFFISCEEKIDELNMNPNTSPVAGDAQVLSSSIGYLGYIVEVNLNRFSSLWAQYYTWGVGVSIGNQERFVSEPDDFNGYWGSSYANALTDLKYLRSSTSNAYRGVSGVLTAYIYQGLVDHFGDIPYSQALSGEIADGSVFTPEFDSAVEVYADLIKILDKALEDLENAVDGEIEGDDLIFGGDIDRWKKFANSLKLRILMRTSEVSDNGTEIVALISSGSFIEDSKGIADIAFSGETGSQNPMYARNEFGVGDFYFASNATLNVLRNLSDPRETIFYAPATTGAFKGRVRGIDQGTIDNEPFTAPAADYSGSSPYAYGEKKSAVLMSPWEVWFLRAEAAARYGTSDDEATAFNTAVQKNFEYMGLNDSSSSIYISALGYSVGRSLDDRLDDIGTQKYISMNGTQEDEGWIETRRFDRPASRLFSDGIFQNPPLSVLPAGTFPASWLYPSSERSYNSNAPAQRDITDRLFWDN